MPAWHIEAERVGNRAAARVAGKRWISNPKSTAPACALRRISEPPTPLARIAAGDHWEGSERKKNACPWARLASCGYFRAPFDDRGCGGSLVGAGRLEKAQRSTCDDGTRSCWCETWVE